MATLSPALLQIKYQKAAEEYLASLTLENFMEATTQATQREITLESLALVKAKRPDFQVFNELLVQYPLPGNKIGQVVPDNMVVISDKPVQADTSYNLPIERVRPFWVLEYVSKHNRRKDFDANMIKYEQQLKIPYYLLFAPDVQEVTLYRLTRGKYLSVKPNRHGRFAIRKLELEMKLVDGWVRYWYQGELLPLPAELQRQLDKTRHELQKERRRADEERRRADEEREARLAAEAELAQLRAEVERMRKKQR